MARLEVRLLGPLRVRRVDGSRVDVTELRTGKTADLVRLLALRRDEAVGVDTLLEALWPDVGVEKGMTSLRTAASHIRRAMRMNCIAHESEGLTLISAWVDVVAFRQLATECRGFVVDERWENVVTVAREACAIYVGDLSANDPSLELLNRERQALRDAYVQLLLDAAEAALKLHWFRDGIDFASRALTMDRYSERAFRTLMNAHTGIGETELARAAFEQCRRLLAEELGADPAPQTLAVFRQLLDPRSAPFDATMVAGRVDEQTWLHETIGDCVKERSTGLVLVSGRPGIGKRTLVDQVVANLPLRVVRGSCLEDSEPVDALLRRERCEAPVVLILQDFEQLDSAAISSLSDELLRAGGPAVVIGLVAGADDYRSCAAIADLRAAAQVHCLTVGPLLRDEIATLAAETLAGAPCSELVDTLFSDSAGHPQQATATLRGWLSRGLVVSTSNGLTLLRTPGQATGAVDNPVVLAQVYERLSTELLDVLALAAVCGVNVRASTLCLLDETVQEESVADALNELCELAVLKFARGRYEFNDRRTRDDVIAWLRPSERQRLHRLVADRAPIDPARRIHHWLAAGEPQRAWTVAMDAASQAVAVNDLAGAYEHLLAVRESCDRPDTDTGQRLRLLELVGDVTAGMGQLREAGQAYRSALIVARMHGCPEQQRLFDKQAELSSRAGAPCEQGETAAVRERDLLVELDWSLLADAVLVPQLAMRSSAAHTATARS